MDIFNEPIQETFHLPTKALVRGILERPHGREWSVQGFGMLRTYLDAAKVWRLNLWHAGLAVKGVSTIHDHPWDFTSWIIAGNFVNRRFVYYTENEHGRHAKCQIYSHMRIKTGPGGGPAGEPLTSYLVASPLEVYQEGDIYTQRAEEIHESIPENGTVTLNQRIRRPDGEHANVFWPHGEAWVDAEPSDATAAEVAFACEASLRAWF